MIDFAKMAAELDGQWKVAEAPKGEYKALPDGKYQVVIESQSVELNTFDKWELKLTLRVTDDSHAGRLIWKRYDLSNPERFGFLKQDLETITGMVPPSMSQLKEFAVTLVNRIIEVNLKTTEKNNKTYQNCYVSKFIGMATPESGNTVAGVNLDNLKL